MIYWIDFQIYFYGFSIFFIHYTFMDLFSKVLLDNDGNFFQFWIWPVIFGNKIQKMWLVTSQVTVGQWRHMWLISKRHPVCFTETKSKTIWKRVIHGNRIHNYQLQSSLDYLENEYFENVKSLDFVSVKHARQYPNF